MSKTKKAYPAADKDCYRCGIKGQFRWVCKYNNLAREADDHDIKGVQIGANTTPFYNITSRQISTNPSYQNLLDILNLRSESVRVNGELNHLLN